MDGTSVLQFFFAFKRTDTEGTTYFDPDRIIVLVLDDRPPITDLMRGNVIDVVC